MVREGSVFGGLRRCRGIRGAVQIVPVICVAHLVLRIISDRQSAVQLDALYWSQLIRVDFFGNVDGVRSLANLLMRDPIVAFYAFFTSHAIAAIFHPFQDCDEVFNFWEPTHYLNHGHGFQTWEYSPEFAIRSWTYTALHAVITPLARFVPFVTNTKTAEFYFLRIMLGFICAVCEARLFSKISHVLNGRIAIMFQFIITTSPGMYHASIAYLPSSFAMYFIMLGMASFMDWRGGLRTAQGIFFMGVGACLGWPFAAAMSIPYLLEEVFLASVSDLQGLSDLFFRLADGVMRTLGVLLLQTLVDWQLFYRKFVLVPLNIVLYNVFSSKGPELYGVEPWHFYLRNLFLNFHVWLLLALVSLPLLLIQHFTRAKGATRSSYLRGIAFLLPFYVWLGIFTLQPHKEERFMYPAYPTLALNAAVASHIVLSNLGSTDPKDLVSRISVRLRFLPILATVVGAMAISAFRVAGAITAYGAPLAIYTPLHQAGVAQAGDNVCLGKEWYRFPSHYLLPQGVKAKFIRSEFHGLLPGEFSEAGQGFGLFPGTHLIPAGMNDENREDITKYTDVRDCRFIVDSNMPSTEATALEPSYIQDIEHWEKVKCLPYLDAASTGIIGRLGWIPDLPFVPAKYRRVWGDYCLLKRKSPSRPEAVCPPSDFRRPQARPYSDWSVTDTPPRPYRPFRYGPYHITMGLRNMHWDEWIELDNYYLRYHTDKARRIEERGSRCSYTDSSPRVFNGAVELLEELASYLSERYPTMFIRTTNGIDNILTNESFDIRAEHLTMNGIKEDPMQLCGRLVEDDLAVMFEREGGQYYLLAGSVLLAGFWRLEDKFGMPLSEIHTSGDVPGYKEKLEKGMTNFFRRVQPEKPVLRNNYFIQVDDNLAWSHSIGREDSETVSWSTAGKNKAIEHHFFRSERQSLRRLPRSGGVVFTIRTYFHPITEIAAEPGVPGRLASAVRSWGEDVSRYKGRERYGEVLLEYLDQKHEEQVEGGLNVEAEEERRAYPY
ncbi:glycosyltransferase family 22 protein [Dothistroma septosporum NZE10]|uniref:Mannosyltransferase n=1 Tax=Dothistroma septosporum (strain NZE10 / CBS 128990) TaxID=675120 RepID=N1PHN3_DOTSN|nr:glycosyltransferase family 22 protein [Dothistroma septosporum NZE10]